VEAVRATKDRSQWRVHDASKPRSTEEGQRTELHNYRLIQALSDGDECGRIQLQQLAVHFVALHRRREAAHLLHRDTLYLGPVRAYVS